MRGGGVRNLRIEILVVILRRSLAAEAAQSGGGLGLGMYFELTDTLMCRRIGRRLGRLLVGRKTFQDTECRRG